MRKETILTHNWYFSKDFREEIPTFADKTWQKVTLPHTWNAEDGIDGGADYHRAPCWYLRELNLYEIKKDHCYFLIFGAACYEAEVFLNGQKLTHHKGGYSAFSAELRDVSRGKNTLAVRVSNAPAGDIYPQMADFTFYGGLTREVTLVEVPETHFDLGFWCASGILAHSEAKENGDALLYLKAAVKNPDEGDSIRFTLMDHEKKPLTELYTDAKSGKTTLPLRGVHLWHGMEDPYLYTIRAELIRRNEVLDTREISHGFRFFSADPEKGFFLNGKPYPLRGVSRHGDKRGLGTALSLEDHRLDMELLRELHANCVRLAHYQHDEAFYSLCDRYGIVVWAEIPFISKMLKSAEAHENAMRQLNELIAQAGNHTSILFWGISNEITIGGDAEGLRENLETLHRLAKEADPSRLTVMAEVSMLPMESEHNRITDVVAYNHYFGWYGGALSDNEAWLDRFHASYPTRPLGLSEYGCEGILSYHTDTPCMGDYSEEYQALYHEHMLRIINERPYLWGTFVWNLFDFGCDMRDEGGVMGRNNKGLVTFDRRIKKDAYYLYKAYWSPVPMVHIAGKRYAKRVGEQLTLKVYSNEKTLILSVNGMEIDKKTGDHVFLFENIPTAKGQMTVTVASENASDRAVFEIVTELPSHYTMQKGAASIRNWFQDTPLPEDTTLTFEAGKCSVRHTLRSLLENDKASEILIMALQSASGMQLKPSQLLMFGDATPEEMLANIGFASRCEQDPKKLLALLNRELQKISL